MVSRIMETTQQQKREKMGYNGPRVRMCTDGKYHWTYPMHMLSNPTVYLTVCKIFGIIGALAFLTAYLGSMLRGDFAAIIPDLPYWGIAVLVFLGISLLAYLIVAAMYGWKYIVCFTMDETGIRHEQHPAQKKNARRIGAAVAGSAPFAGNVGRIGQGMAVASHTQLSSDFSCVRRVKAYPRRSTIKVHEPFAHNQIYTAPEDFDFVLSYIRSHCPKLK